MTIENPKTKTCKLYKGDKNAVVMQFYYPAIKYILTGVTAYPDVFETEHTTAIFRVKKLKNT